VLTRLETYPTSAQCFVFKLVCKPYFLPRQNATKVRHKQQHFTYDFIVPLSFEHFCKLCICTAKLVYYAPWVYNNLLLFANVDIVNNGLLPRWKLCFASGKGKVKVKVNVIALYTCIALRREHISKALRYGTGSHSFTCTPRVHPLTEPYLPLPSQPNGPHLPTPEGWKAELAWMADYIPR